MIRIVMALVVLAAFYRRLRRRGRQRGTLGILGTIGLGIPGALVGGVVASSLVDGDGFTRDLVAGVAALVGAVTFIAAGEVATRRYPPRRRLERFRRPGPPNAPGSRRSSR